MTKKIKTTTPKVATTVKVFNIDKYVVWNIFDVAR